MKKRVRIYKSPTGEGQFLNKTAQFLRKAQMGGAPTAEELSYPGATQGQTQQVDDNQLASLVLQDISNSRPKEEIVVKLVNMYGKDPMEATTLVNQMYTYLEEQSEAQKEEDSEESSDEEITGGDPEDAQEETVMNPVQETEEDFYGDDTSNDMANQVANEDDEVEDDDTDVASQVTMMRGGYMRAQDGAEVESEYPIIFPGVEAYLPANMSDMMGGSYDIATGEAWQRPEFTAPETSDDAGISYGYMDQGAEEAMVEDAPEGIPTEESEYRKGGAYKKGKSAYVNSVLKLVKKQMGGDQEDNNPNDLTKKEDQSDPIGNDLRRGILSNYIGTLKNQGQMAVAKEEAEQQYDQMMQQQQMMQQGMPQAPMNYSENGEMLDEAQFGGLFNRRRNQEGQERRGLFNRQPKIPQGFGYGYPPIESVDVRRSGIFGRPKEYSVNFGEMPSVMPGYGRQGSGAGFYGYGYTGIKKSPARRIVEDNAIYVNSQSNKDVAAVAPGNEATNKDVIGCFPGGTCFPDREKVETKQEGGMIQDPFSDEYGNLQRFVYGGDDDLSLANIYQSDIDYTGSEDVTDPYFQRGGLFKNLFPANLNTNYFTQYMGARNAAGEVVPGYFGKNSQLKSVDVQKTGLLSGRPKKYSVTFSNQSSDPTKPMISLDRPGTESVIPKKAPMVLSQREMDRGDREAGRQRPLTAGKKYEKYFEEPMVNEEKQVKANGGALRKFIPTAQYGGDSPVVYTNNPAMDGMTDVDMLSLNPGIQGLDQSSLTSFMNVDSPTRDQSQDPKQYTVDPNQASRQQTEKVYEPEGDVTYDFKTKAGMDNASVQGALLTGNAVAKGALGFVDRMQNNKNEAKMYKNLTSDNLYASDPSRDRGDYESNSGLYRPDEMGQTWNSRSAQMGGQNSYLNEDPDYVEGDEVDMTDEELANFIANGGEVEYL